MAADRFMDKVASIPIAGCWLWTGSVSPLGYGQLTHGNKHQTAHRFSWRRSVGEIPPGMCVLHRCDVPSCVNPHHLFLGTKRDNTHDMMKKGRDRCIGERNPGAKLTSADIAAIRAHSESCVKAARRFGVSRSTISAIRRGETRVSHEGERL